MQWLAAKNVAIRFDKQTKLSAIDLVIKSIITTTNKKIFGPLIYSLIVANRASNELVELREQGHVGHCQTRQDRRH